MEGNSDDDLSAKLAEMRSYIPAFNPPLHIQAQPIWIPMLNTVAKVLSFGYLKLFNPPSPLDYHGPKPECYREHETSSPLENPPVSHMELLRVLNSPRPDEEQYTHHSGRIFPDKVYKASHGDSLEEGLSLLLIKTLTSIPVPKVVQITAKDKWSYLITERIEGKTLTQCWPDLSFWSKVHVMWTIGCYVRQLQQIRREGPGRLGDSVCAGVWFTVSDNGPFSSYSELVKWYNGRLRVAQKFGHAPPDAPVFDTSSPLVFTHGDINPDNFILDESGKLFMIDWGFSGFYPQWMEYACAHRYSEAFCMPRSWSWLLPLAVGFYNKDYARVQNIGWAIVMGRMITLNDE